MPVVSDFALARYEDGILTMELAPPDDVSGWDIRFSMAKRFGSSGSGYYQASVSSGYSGESGITITNSGIGQMNITIPGSATSGLEYGNYAYNVTRHNPRVSLAEGFLILQPGQGGLT